MSGRQTGVTVDHLPGRLSSGPPDSANSHAAVAGLPETGPRGLPCELASHASVAGHPETGPQRLQRDTLSTRAAVAGLPRSGPQRLQRRFHTQPLRDSRRSARSGCNVSRAWGGGEDTRPPARSNFFPPTSSHSPSPGSRGSLRLPCAQLQEAECGRVGRQSDRTHGQYSGRGEYYGRAHDLVVLRTALTVLRLRPSD